MSVVEEPLIQAQHLHLKRAHRHVLQDISMAVQAKEIVTIIGPNGCGKSSLLRILLGLSQPHQGTVVRATGLRVGYMPQRLEIDERLPLTVEGFLWLTRGARQVRIDEWLKRLDIEGLRRQPVQRLSGGEW